MTSPTPPIAWGRPVDDLVEVFAGDKVAVSEQLLEQIAATGASVTRRADDLAEASRDWWPFALRWALAGRVPALPAAVVRPANAAQVADVLRLAGEAAVPVTAGAGRSGVCGGAVPLYGGIALDCLGLNGVRHVDTDSLLVEVGAGTFGPDLAAELRTHGVTVGHSPQSFDLATVGGWVACRGAGQHSTRYGKIEEIVAGLEVVTAGGEILRTGSLQGSGPRSAMGPDLTQIFVGSEGTLAVITSVELRVHPVPPHERRRAWGFARFADGIEALRLTLRAGATPAVVRLYDATESLRSFAPDGTKEARNVLLVLDEGDPVVVESAISVLDYSAERCGGEQLDDSLVATWLEHRNDVSILESITRAGIVADTIEVAARWSELPGLYADGVQALREVDGCLAASAHESHAYLDGACLYFTFAGRGEDPADDATATRYYERSWSAVMDATAHHHGSISHHHGIGIVRGRYLREALGDSFGVLRSLKDSLDPKGILNPGKLGLDSPFGPAPDLSAGLL